MGMVIVTNMEERKVTIIITNNWHTVTGFQVLLSNTDHFQTDLFDRKKET